jgi:hypothetical protein
MKAINISLSLDRGISVITVIPEYNGENNYSTYWKLYINKHEWCDIRFNADSEWEVCQGSELPQNELEAIVKQIEPYLYKNKTQKSESKVLDKTLALYNKVKSALKNKQKGADSIYRMPA